MLNDNSMRCVTSTIAPPSFFLLSLRMMAGPLSLSLRMMAGHFPSSLRTMSGLLALSLRKMVVS